MREVTRKSIVLLKNSEALLPLDQFPSMIDYDIRNGRTYMYFEGEPQVPFGYGLSYTMSELSDLQTDANSAKADGKFVVSVTVGNTGDHLRGEVVQVYVRFPASEVERPTTQPKGIQHVTVDAGKTEIVEVTMNATDLDYWNLGKQAWTVEPGPVDLLDGHSPAVAHLALSATVTVSG